MRKRTWVHESVRVTYLTACLIWNWHKTTGAKKMLIRIDTLRDKAQPKHALAWLFATSVMQHALRIRVHKQKRKWVFIATEQNLRRLDALRDVLKTLLLLLS